MNQKSRKFWEFRVSASEGSADLLLYGPISETTWFGDEVTPKQFAEELQALGEVPELNVYINSPGGDAFASQAIHSMLKRHKAKVNVQVDGLAASGASIVAMAGDVVRMPRNAMMMVHNPWTWTWGESKDLREQADLLDKIRETLISVYEEKTGLSREEIGELLDAETWFTAEEAVEWGFADELVETQTVAAALKGHQLRIGGMTFDISQFRSFPQETVEIVTEERMKEDDDMQLDVETLAKDYPELYNAVKQEGVQEERARIKAIEEVALPGAEDIVTKAKFETGASAESVAMDIIKAQRAKGEQYLKNARMDAAEVVVEPDAAPDTAAKDNIELDKLKAAFGKGANLKRGDE